MSHPDPRQEPIPKPSRPIRAGDLVEIPGVRTPAEVVSADGEILRLKAGAINMKVKVSEVRLIEAPERAALAQSGGKKKRGASVGAVPKGGVAIAPRAAAQRELDIRGMETIEAEGVVENFLSGAVMGHLETVVIIHGKGTGALRKAVHAVLKRNKAVKAFRLGVYGEGEDGVTVVTLKK